MTLMTYYRPLIVSAGCVEHSLGHQFWLIRCGFK